MSLAGTKLLVPSGGRRFWRQLAGLVALLAGVVAAAPDGARAAETSSGFQLLVTIDAQVQLGLSAQSLQLSAATGGQQASLNATLHANAPWTLTLTPSLAQGSPELPPGAVQWRVDNGSWQALTTTSSLSVSGSSPTGDAGRQVPIEFKLTPSFAHPAGAYTLNFTATATATL